MAKLAYMTTVAGCLLLLAAVSELASPLPEPPAAQATGLPADDTPVSGAPPSAHRKLYLDYTRRVMTCSAAGCQFELVRSQQELLDALVPLNVQQPHSSQKRRSAARSTKALLSEAATPVVSIPIWPVIGSCYGADLPATAPAGRAHPRTLTAENRQR